MKKAIILICIAAALLSMCACGKTIELDVKAAAAELVEKVEYQDTLYELPENMLPTLYGITDGMTGAAYAGSGATAEEVAVFDAGSDKTAEELMKTMQTRLDDRAESYANYMPDEVFKIENAVLQQHGKYVILCVTDDTDSAKAVIDGLVK